MKKIFTLVLLILIIIACQNGNKHNHPTKKEAQKANNIESSHKEKIDTVFNQFKLLYFELLSFKDDDNFKKYGFGAGGKYNNWIKDIENLKNNPDSKLLIQKGVLISELETLGYSYVGSKGKETDVTRTFNKIFTEAINDKPAEKSVNNSGNENYDKIRSNYKLFGKWIIKNTIVKEEYPYEIYQKGAEYIGVRKVNYKTETLERKGDKFVIKGNKWGEYFIIDENKRLTMFDKDGELASMGYIAIKVK